MARVVESCRNPLARGGALLKALRDVLLRTWQGLRPRRGWDAQETGRWGEKTAEKYLRSKGYRILGRRVRLSPRDELDLVARQEDVLVFVEVKARRSEEFGRPVAAINASKRRALTRAALHYVKQLKTKPPYLRFDVVEVVGVPSESKPLVRHIENCFTLSREHRIAW